MSKAQINRASHPTTFTALNNSLAKIAGEIKGIDGLVSHILDGGDPPIVSSFKYPGPPEEISEHDVKVYHAINALLANAADLIENGADVSELSPLIKRYPLPKAAATTSDD